MLCYFQVQSKVNQLFIYIHPLFFRFLSHIGYCSVLSRVPCAIQQVLSSYLFYVQQCNWIQSHMLSRWSQQHLTLSRLDLWNNSHCGNEWQADCTFLRQGSRLGASDCQGSAQSSNHSSHIFSMTSFIRGKHFTCTAPPHLCLVARQKLAASERERRICHKTPCCTDTSTAPRYESGSLFCYLFYP